MRTLLGVLGLAAALTTGGAVARQALYLSPGPIVAWRCPDCGAGNAGDPQTRYDAVCRVCTNRHAWDDVERVTGEDSRRR